MSAQTHPSSSSLLFPPLHITIPSPRPLSPRLNQRMRRPIVAPILHPLLLTQRPRGLGLHVTEHAFGKGDKVRAVRRLGLAELDRAVRFVIAAYNRSYQVRRALPALSSFVLRQSALGRGRRNDRRRRCRCRRTKSAPKPIVRQARILNLGVKAHGRPGGSVL